VEVERTFMFVEFGTRILEILRSDEEVRTKMAAYMCSRVAVAQLLIQLLVKDSEG